jgi:hypothetical protein
MQMSAVKAIKGRHIISTAKAVMISVYIIRVVIELKPQAHPKAAGSFSQIAINNPPASIV